MKFSVNSEEKKILLTDAYNAKFGKVDALYSSVIFSGELKCEVLYDYEPKSCVIRPLSLGIKPELCGNKVSFTIDKPCNISVEVNDDILDSLIVFAEEKEEMPEGYKNVMVFEKGEHAAGQIRILENDTLVYFAEGAYVHGKVIAENVENLCICGNGILSMESYERSAPLQKCVEIISCRNVKISGIKIIDSCAWSMKITGCDDVDIDSVRIIGNRGNSDGVDICGSRNVHVNRVFTRVMDDSLVLKAFDTGDVENVLFENCTLWNDFARPIEIGVEIRADKAHNIRYNNIDIIHSMVGYPCIGIHHGDRGEVYDIIVDDVRIEDAPGAQLFDLRITDSVWNTDTKKGRIHDITFKNISLIGKPGIDILPSNSRIQGFSDESNIDKINFENISIMGKQATTPEECGLLIQDFVSNVTFKADDSKEKINLIKTDVEIGREFELNENGFYSGSVIITAENTTDKELSSHFKLQINPVNRAKFDDSFFEFTLAPYEKKSKEYDVEMQPGKFVLLVQSDDVNIYPGWKYIELDMIMQSDITKAYEYTINDYFGDESKPFRFAADDEFLTIKSDVLKENNIIIYTAKPVDVADGQVMFTAPETDCGESPAIINGRHGYELAPQLRCPAEITYVFENEPKVEQIRKVCTEKKHYGVVRLPWSFLGLEKGVKNFWFEIEIASDKKYPYAMFRSAAPDTMAHMFANVKVK